jgi:hypothetical protein
MENIPLGLSIALYIVQYFDAGIGQ